jgi:hypothetical protein
MLWLLPCFFGTFGRKPKREIGEKASSRHIVLFNIYSSGLLKGSLTRDFWLQVFSRISFLSGPWVSYWGHFEFLRKFVEIFATSCLSPVRHQRNCIQQPDSISTKSEKNFLSHFFFIYRLCRWQRWLTFTLKKSPRIFVKIRNVPHGILYSTQAGARGKLVHEKNLK